MIDLLFAIVYWWGLTLAAMGALMLGGMLCFWASEKLHDLAGPRERQPRPVPPRSPLPSFVPLRPYDQEDPLERSFSLPCAPDPRRLA